MAVVAASSVFRPSWLTALGVAASAVGCMPAGSRAPEAALAPLSQRVAVGPLGGLELRILRNGDADGPRVVFVHGTPGSAASWGDYVLAPMPGTESVALDRPGFGVSAPDDALPRLRDQAAAVRALLPAPPRRAVLVGHSLGGAVAARVAAEEPSRVSALVLLAASLDPAQERVLWVQRLGAWPPVRALLPRAIRNANAELMALEPELRALAAMLPSIRAKVVIVHGTADDLVPPANVPYALARLRGARCLRTVMLDGRDHFLPWRSAGAVRDALREALEPAC